MKSSDNKCAVWVRVRRKEGDFAFLQVSLGLLFAHGCLLQLTPGVDKLLRLENLIGAPPPPHAATGPKK